MVDLAGAILQNESDVYGRIVRSFFIVQYGVITEVNGDLVKVIPCVVDDKNKVIEFYCPLLSLTSSNITVKVQAKEGDKVILFFPKTHSSDMFSNEQKGVVVKKFVNSYSANGCFAVLCGRPSEQRDENFLNIDDKEFALKVKDDRTVSVKVKDTEVVIDENKVNAKVNNTEVVIDENKVNVKVGNTEVVIDDSKVSVKIGANEVINANGSSVSLFGSNLKVVM